MCLTVYMALCVSWLEHLYQPLHITKEDLACGEITTNSMVQGHHVYQQVWTSVIEESISKESHR